MADDRAGAQPWAPIAHRAQNHRRGIFLMLIATAVFCMGDSAVKFMTRDYEVMQIVWARYTFHALLFLIVFSRTGLRRQIATRRPFLQVARSVLLLSATVMFFSGLQFLPLADAAAIIFVVPLLVTALSIFVLRERIGPHRWAAIFVGFCGVLVIVRPGLGLVHWAAIFPLGCAFCYALYQVLTRIAARTEEAIGSLFWTSAVGVVVSSAIAPFYWTPPTPLIWTLMIATGSVFGLGHLLLIKAFEITPPSVLSPFIYTQMIWATFLGLVIFGDFPDEYTFAGVTVVILSGLYIWYRETRIHRRPA